MIKSVEGPAHGIEAVLRVDKDSLGGLERVPRLQLPAEGPRVDAHAHTGDIPGVDLGPGQEVSGIDQADPQSLSAILIRAGTFQQEKRIVLVGGVAAAALDALDAGAQMVLVDIALPAPGAGQLDELIVRILQVQIHAHGCIEPDL